MAKMTFLGRVSLRVHKHTARSLCVSPREAYDSAVKLVKFIEEGFHAERESAYLQGKEWERNRWLGRKT